MVVLGYGGRLVVPAGQHAAGQRHPGDDADTRVGRGGEHPLQRLATEDVEDDLQAREAGPRQRRERLVDRLHRHAVRRDPAVVDQGVQGVEHTVVTEDRVGRTVQLDEVDGVDAQVAAAAVDPATEAVEGVGLCDVRVGTPTHLRGNQEDHVIALGPEPADDGLAAPVTVDVRGVQERHAGVDGGVQDAQRLPLVHLAPVGAELPAAEPDDGGLSAEAGEGAGLHGGFLPVRCVVDG
jgi:hypothetical protein